MEADTGSGIHRLRAAIALGLNVKVSELVELQRIHADGEVVGLLRSDLAKAASHPDLSPAIHQCLADHESAEVRFGAVFHPSVSESEREQRMAGFASYELKPDVLDDNGHWWMAAHEQVEYRRRVARSWSISADVLGLLAADEDDQVRAAVAGNPNAGRVLLAELAEDESLSVVKAIVSNFGADAELLDDLANRLAPEDFSSCNNCSPELTARVIAGFGWDSVEGVAASLANTGDGSYGQRSAILNLSF